MGNYHVTLKPKDGDGPKRHEFIYGANSTEHAKRAALAIAKKHYSSKDKEMEVESCEFFYT